jgi:hypothetical protein
LAAEVGVVRNDKARRLAMAWAALLLGALAWFAAHQFGSNLSFADCDANGGLQTGISGLLALLLTGAGALLSWRVWKGDTAEGHAFAALAGMLAAGLLAIAIVLQTIAAFIVPSCYG